MSYDLIIIGCGPSGLALAQKCKGKKILMIDKESVIGGCHRVRRVKVGDEYLFTEHGPRVYSQTYVVFKKLLLEMGVEFENMFSEYNFSITRIGNETIFSVLDSRELGILAKAFGILLINNDYGTRIVLEDYIKSFSPESKEMIDRVCKMTDGGGIDKFTLNEFLQLFNQQFFYKLYQPNKPNDIGLFKVWRKFLESNSVEFMLDSEITSVEYSSINNSIVSMNITGKTIYSKNFVLAIPPESLYNFLTKLKVPHTLGDLKLFSQQTEYNDYVSIVFHWDKPLELKDVYGFPKSDWGVAFVVLTDYMSFYEKSSKTVITSSISITDRVSSYTKKTANESSLKELQTEVFRQLKESFGDMPEPTAIVMSPGVSFSSRENKWVCEDTAYINSALSNSLPFECGPKNLYNLGTHNGKSLYKFTSMESAVSNSVYLSSLLYKENRVNKEMITRNIAVTDIAKLSFVAMGLKFFFK